MTSVNEIAGIAALVGEPARAAMLGVLLDGRALTAAELASAAGVTPQTASSHLARLTAAGLLAVEAQGRHRYHRLAHAEVARLLEGIMQVAAAIRPAPVVGPRDQALRTARTCYDHIAGRLGVALADALAEAGHVELSRDGGIVTESGLAELAGLGVEIDTEGRKSKRILCRPCLDWSERRVHIAGAVGAALCARAFEAGWIRRLPNTRALSITPKGTRAFREKFGVNLN
ncbi:MAG TPA: helix-turn-helix transcriptional regulator [Stellaceae bacterium]|nr:helix-turn-helix transcriptional regulator [Stellaceae bacterium]